MADGGIETLDNFLLTGLLEQRMRDSVKPTS